MVGPVLCLVTSGVQRIELGSELSDEGLSSMVWLRVVLMSVHVYDFVTVP